MFHELTSHAPPLRSLAAHHEGDPWSLLWPWRENAPDLRGGLTLRKGIQFLDDIRCGARDQRQTMLVMIAPGAKGVSQVGEDWGAPIGLFLCLQPRTQPQSRGAQCPLGAGGQ
ncbi:MAG: hypothetical protein WAM53_02535, partial [Terrimicrobiaceae bacterium]